MKTGTETGTEIEEGTETRTGTGMGETVGGVTGLASHRETNLEKTPEIGRQTIVLGVLELGQVCMITNTQILVLYQAVIQFDKLSYTAVSCIGNKQQLCYL
jgi:hypothetical protein